MNLKTAQPSGDEDKTPPTEEEVVEEALVEPKSHA
jgi:hypothetical protein